MLPPMPGLPHDVGQRLTPAPQPSGGTRAPGHITLLWSLDSIPSPCILKPYSFPVPLIRNANDVMKLDSLVAFS